MTFREELRRRARARPRRVGFPEADEERTGRAVRSLAARGLVRPVVLARPGEAVWAAFEGMEGVELLHPGEAAAGTGPTVGPDGDGPGGNGRDGPSMREEAEPLRLAADLLAAGRLDGVVAGARATTAEVVRVALDRVGLAPGTETLSSAFYLSRMARDPGGAGVLTFTDVAVVPEPTPEQMAEIAEAACHARSAVVGDEPRVAFLSYATRGSAAGPAVEKVRRALVLFRERCPEVAADGELQVDAALVPEVGRRKAPASPVAGRANVLVFPDLTAGNIGYKLVERLAGASALGPVLQGLRAPLNDLSRGAEVEDIVDAACVTALMAG